MLSCLSDRVIIVHTINWIEKLNAGVNRVTNVLFDVDALHFNLRNKSKVKGKKRSTEFPVSLHGDEPFRNLAKKESKGLNQVDAGK